MRKFSSTNPGYVVSMQSTDSADHRSPLNSLLLLLGKIKKTVCYLGVAALFALLMGASSGFSQTTATLSYSPAAQSFTVPAGVTSMTVYVYGAGGGSGGFHRKYC